MTSLEARILDAHDRHDQAALVQLYAEAADLAATVDAQAFFLTQAHVFALEIGHPDAQHLRGRLIALGRETPL